MQKNILCKEKIGMLKNEVASSIESLEFHREEYLRIAKYLKSMLGVQARSIETIDSGRFTYFKIYL